MSSVLFVVVLTTIYYVRTFTLYISVYSTDQINRKSIRVDLTYILESFFKNAGKIGGRFTLLSPLR